MIYYLTIIIIIVIVNFYKKKINMKNLKHVLLFVVFIDSNQRKKHLHGAGMVSITFKNNRLNYNEFFF